jgi:hypothetical protein
MSGIIKLEIRESATELRELLNSRDCREVTTRIQVLYRSAQKAIITAKELLSPEEQKAIIELIDGEVYLQNRTHLYILTRIA